MNTTPTPSASQGNKTVPGRTPHGPSSGVSTSAPRPGPIGSGSPKRRGRPWSLDSIREVLAGTEDPALLRELDRRGMSASTYALLQAATATDDLRPLLTLLEPPETREETQLDQILALLQQIAESQIRTERRMLAVESMLVASPGASPSRSASTGTASRS